MKRIAVITGASSGLGEEFTRQVCANYDYDEIWIIARREDKLRTLADNLNATKNFTTVHPVVLDVAGKEGVERFKKLLESEDEKLRKVESGIEIGLLINNAGFGTYGPFAETSINRQMDMIELNCTTVTGICGVALPYLKKDSVIINTASLAAFLPLGNFAVYGATKAYVLNFSVALAAELHDKGIKVCALCPGSVSTEFANVASNGARPEVKGGIPPKKVVAQCLKRAFKNKRISMLLFKWRITAFMSRFVSGYIGARYTYLYNKRPHNPDADMIKKAEEISVSDFI
ncbi:SDR family NAD(P)-dependent oxidoreductase [Treponema bryantii]|uniref:SDR family NAD(P)-dependent oxidoreductase n=1 Tax=Treponema bryantii TaxID=163 RepID=UPI002B323C4B|nr:short-chain dehydrogenase [Treponema bryantii]